MPDESHLDEKYFIDKHIYNCPFCNRRHVAYTVVDQMSFHWSEKKRCYVYAVQCDSCKKRSLHLSFTDLDVSGSFGNYVFGYGGDIDAVIFYSVPTSFFVMDERIPRILRELITEAEGSLKMNFLTGASACARKAIYELTVIAKAEGENYEDRIKSLKTKHPEVDAALFDVLAHIQDMTSDKIHEQSWPKWDSPQLRVILETLRAVLQEIYVVPKEREERVRLVQQMREEMLRDKKPAEAVATEPTAQVKSKTPSRNGPPRPVG